MTDLELAARLREVAVAGFERWRKQHSWGAIVTPTPHRLLDEIAAGVTPVLRELVAETVTALLPGLVEAAVAARLDTPGVRDLDAAVREVS